MFLDYEIKTWNWSSARWTGDNARNLIEWTVKYHVQHLTDSHVSFKCRIFKTAGNATVNKMCGNFKGTTTEPRGIDLSFWYLYNIPLYLHFRLTATLCSVSADDSIHDISWTSQYHKLALKTLQSCPDQDQTGSWRTRSWILSGKRVPFQPGSLQTWRKTNQGILCLGELTLFPSAPPLEVLCRSCGQLCSLSGPLD